MWLIGTFVDSYLRLNDREDRMFAKKMEQAKLKPQEKEAIVEYVTSWEERGIAKGLELGRVEAWREMLLDVLITRFGSVDAGIAARIQRMDSAADLKDLAHRALTAGSLDQLGLDTPS